MKGVNVQSGVKVPAHHISRTFFFNIFLRFFFSFSRTCDHIGGKKSTLSLKVQSRFSSQNSCILLGKVSTKVVQRIVKLQSLDCFTFSLTCSHVKVKASNGISSEGTHQIHFPTFMYTLREGLYQSCEKNCEILNFGHFWAVFQPPRVSRRSIPKLLKEF